MNRKLKFDLALMMLVLWSAFVFTACTRKPAGTVETVGWTLDNNQRAKLADYKGKVVVLDFYATWCEPCRAETPRLVELQRQYAAQGLQVIGLNVGGADDRDLVPGYAREFGIQYPLGFPDDEVADSFLGDDQNIPQAFVFDRGGKLVKRFIGYSENSGVELERVVKSSLAAGAAARPRGPQTGSPAGVGR
ncbi:MAG TPA: TlpA disulfide reductase family protein [Pyrinomonadaceae bacterium]|nr:TlpA disulfide reductase family protein [Pyrinomonadaceae bacterium]